MVAPDHARVVEAIGEYDWRKAEEDPLAEAAGGIIAYMNDDHADALVTYARAFTRATEAQDAVMVSIDRYGFEMSVGTSAGRRPARIALETPLTASTEARKVLIDLLRVAIAKLASVPPLDGSGV